METAVSDTNTSKAPVHKALKRCTGFSIFSDTKEIVFQKPGAISIVIAPAKKNKVVSFTCNAASADYPGRIYACWDDEKFNPGNSDIFLAYSDDNGDTWTEPILVTYRPNHKTQVMPQVATDKKGYVYIIYYDGQNSADNKLADVYLAISKNGGLKFEYYRVNSRAFKLNNRKKVTLLETEPVTAAWTEKKGCSYSVVIRDSILDAYNVKQADKEVRMERSFVFADTINVNFTLKNESRVSAIITKPLEPGFEKWILRNKKLKQGSNRLIIKTKSAGLKKGNYILTLYYDHRNTYSWIIEE